ncbi:MAG TPA: hypothetical protein QGH28_08270 [Chloroflexota bacterium]|nr:hypothetical protein [Chloroflexota bacterium]
MRQRSTGRAAGNRLMGEWAAAESIVEGEMPPNAYVLLKPAAGLEPVEQRDLIRGLRATPGRIRRR